MKLLPQNYTIVTSLPTLGVAVPGGAVHLTTLRPTSNLTARDLSDLQEKAPGEFGLQCTAPIDVTLLTTDWAVGRGQVNRWARTTTARVLLRRETTAAFLSGPPGAPVLTLVETVGPTSALVVATCPVRVGGAGNSWIPLAQFADPPTLVSFDRFGHLAWCGVGRSAPLAQVQAYRGGVQLGDRSRDGVLVATVGWDPGGPVLKVWRSTTGALVSSAPLPELPTQVAFTDDARTVVLFSRTEAAYPDALVIRMDVASGNELGRLKLPAGEQPAAVTGDGQRVATTIRGRSPGVRLRTVADGRELWRAKDFQSKQFAFARGDGWLVGANEFGRLEAWKTGDGAPQKDFFRSGSGQVVFRPGAKDGEVTVLLVEATSLSAPGKWTVSSWVPGTTTLAARGTLNLTGQEAVVLHPRTGAPQTVPYCDVTADAASRP